ncbi:MAG TPA: SMP-30/gluconolactonase/LRE family protein [Polyangia bacterium]
MKSRFVSATLGVGGLVLLTAACARDDWAEGIRPIGGQTGSEIWGTGGVTGGGSGQGGLSLDAAAGPGDDGAGGAGPGSDAGQGGQSGQGGSPPSNGADTGTGAQPASLNPAGFRCPSPAGMTGNPLPAMRTATLIRDRFAPLEGPVWVESQKALYFCEAGSSVTTGRIHKYTPADNRFVVFAEGVGVGGLALDPEGKLIAAAHDKQRLSRFDPANGQRSDVAGGSAFMGRPFNQVNDVVVRSDGNMYFSDPTYQQGGRIGQGVMAFYRLSPTGMVSRIAIARNPNGVALSPDGMTLYLASTEGPALIRFALGTDGTPMQATFWRDRTSDGLAVDCAGNLYLSESANGGQIRVISPTDMPLGSITGLGSGYVTNSAFGGEDRKTLFITTNTALYKITLNLPGFPN